MQHSTKQMFSVPQTLPPRLVVSILLLCFSVATTTAVRLVDSRQEGQRHFWPMPRRALLDSGNQPGGSLGGNVAFLVGVSVGAASVLIALLTAGIWILYSKCNNRPDKTRTGSFVETIEMAQPLSRSLQNSEGRISFMRSTVSHDASFQAIEHLEVDKIQLGNSLGRGAFGKVYRGEYAGIPLAIKIFEHDGTVLCQGNEPLETYVSRNTDHPNVVKTLVNETRRCQSFNQSLTQGSSQSPFASMNLSHSHHPQQSPTELDVTSPTDISSDDEFSYLARAMRTNESDDNYQTWVVMEYCDRGSLHQAIKDKLFFVDEQSTRPIIRFMLLSAHDIASAMNYLHQERVVHGDLKSQNVLLKGSDNDERGFVCKAISLMGTDGERDVCKAVYRWEILD